MDNEDERNVLREAAHIRETQLLGDYLQRHTEDIKRIVAHHFRLSSKEECDVTPRSQWRHGGFNISIQVYITSLQNKVMFRCPMAHKLALFSDVDPVDEKSRGEVATKIWLRRHCPSLSTARLHGFQFPDGSHFTRSSAFSLRGFLRLCRRYICKYMNWNVPSWYLRTDCATSLRTGYIIEDFLEGTPLSQRLLSSYNPLCKRNFMSSIAEIILTFAQTPVPQIGSWTFNNDGTISLTGRPLSCSLAVQENDGAERVIQPGTTYTNAELFISDLLSSYDNWFIAEPNAITDAEDCRAQLGVSLILRAISSRYFNATTRGDPFIMSPTDLNLSNLLVDEAGNVKHLVDHEFYCSLPLGMSYQLRWLSGLPIDHITKHNLEDFERTILEFLDTLKEAEAERRKVNSSLIPISDSLKSGWVTGRFWFSAAVMSVNTSYNLFQDHIQPRFNSSPLTQKMYDRISSFSSIQFANIVERKLADKASYEREKAIVPWP